MEVPPGSAGLILVVDDDDGMRETTMDILHTGGFTTVGAHTVAEALSMRSVLDPAVVLVDYRLPGASGLDLAMALKAGDRDLPVLLMTAYASVEVAVEGVRWLDEILTKPVPADQLLRAVRQSAERRRLVVENRGLIERLRDVNAHQALHDPLTGLANRALFLDRLERGLSQSERRAGVVAVMFIDVDDFKAVNDTLGHDVGDRLLIAVAERLQSAIRDSDSLARFGGDEFTILCTDVQGESGALRVAEQVLKMFERPLDVGDIQHFVTVSIGIALTRDTHTRPEIMLRNADTAMYQAKRKGKSRWEMFDDVMRARVVQRFETEHALRTAVGGEELLLHFQPEVDLRTGEVIGSEALVRWRHPTRGELAPTDFIPVAEESLLILAIGEWVMRRAVEQTLVWLADGTVQAPFTMWVNVSPRQLSEPRFPGMVAGILQATGLPWGCLGIEVTESAVVEDVAATTAVLTELRALGVRLAIDDFGTGWSTLTWLQQLPIDVIKVDRTFVSGIASGRRDSAIVQAIVALGHALDLTIVAEGIETADQLAALRAVGCDAGQGYFLGRPVPPMPAVPRPRSAMELPASLRL